MDGWIMHQPLKSRSTRHQTSTPKSNSGKAKKSKIGKGKKSSRGLDAFASADDYMPDIENDLAALPADVSQVEEDGGSGPSVRKRSKKGQSRKRGNG